jgi:hypothetical protein
MQDKSYYDNNDTDPYVIKTTTTRDLFPHSIRLRDECAYRSRSSTPPDLSNIPIYTYSNTDRSTPARSADSHKSPFRTPRRTNLSRTFRTPSRTRSTSVPNKKLFVFVLLKGQFLRVLREGKKNKISQISNFRCDDDALLQSSSSSPSSSLIDDRFDSIPLYFLFVVYVVVR